MIAIIDNYDSFVFNIARYFREIGEEVAVIRNDAMSVDDLKSLSPEALVVSPGPCTPGEAGISLAAIRELSATLPILGICLGHQCIGAAFGGRVVPAKRPLHGQASRIAHNADGIFRALPTPLQAGRYHSLIVELDPETPLVVTAHSEEGEIMGLAHTARPVYGVQFHPESILTEHGHAMLSNFLALARTPAAHHTSFALAGD